MSRPKLSVVIPAYNASQYIGECLNSVLLQQNSPPFEVIVVDDGSTDGTFDLVSRSYPGIRLLTQSNKGPGSARNLGVKHSSGEVIVFIDADDIMLPDRLEVQGTFMLANPTFGLTFGNLRYQSRPTYDPNQDRGVAESMGFTEVTNAYTRLVVEGNFVLNPSTAVRRDVYLEIGGQSEELFVSEDYAMCCSIAKKWPIAASRRYLTWYRQDQFGSLMKTPLYTYRGPVVALMHELEVASQVLTNEEYSRAVRRFCKLTNTLLRWTWIESGREAVLRELAYLHPLVPESLRRKWILLSACPPHLGRALRYLKRHAHKVSWTCV